MRNPILVAGAEPDRPLHIGFRLLELVKRFSPDASRDRKPDVIRIDGEPGVGGVESFAGARNAQILGSRSTPALIGASPMARLACPSILA